MRTSRTGTIIAGVALLVAACGGGGGGASADDGDGGDGATPAASASIEVEAGDLYYEQGSLAAIAGEIDFTLVNVGAVEHDLVIEEAGDEVVAVAAPGETATGTIALEAGSYTYYCSVPGHRTSMEGTLEVS